MRNQARLNLDDMRAKFKFAIDRGGTFTDIFAMLPDNTTTTYKLLSENPLQYSDAPFEGIKRIINQYYRSRGDDALSQDYEIEWVRMGTTIATNALLERKGAKMALLVTKGFKDALYISNQARPNLFELDIRMPEVLYETVVEIDERLILVKMGDCELPEAYFEPATKISESTGVDAEQFIVWKEPATSDIERAIKSIQERGIKSIAVVFMHSYSCRMNEELVERTIRSLIPEEEFMHVSLSSKVMPMVNLVPRGQTTCLDAYLTPRLKTYVNQFVRDVHELRSCNKTSPDHQTIIHFMQSDGGLVDKHNFNGSRALISGPAGGVIGYSKTTFRNFQELDEDVDAKFPKPVIGFDMGGTSTDVSRFDGQYEHVYDSVVAGITVQCPQLDIQTVAAGGGSRLFFRKGLLVVGPESAGSNPGPKCYRKNGPLCITDANLCLGRLLPEYFPKLFGPKNDEALDEVATLKAFDILTRDINAHYSEHEKTIGQQGSVMTPQEVALGFISIANETMCRAIRNITQAKGYDTAKHILACFGSASGQHACAIARILNISKVFIHKYSGILSAYGIALADVVTESQEPSNTALVPSNYKMLLNRFERLESKCRDDLFKQNPYLSGSAKSNNIIFIRYLQMTYQGTFCPIMCSLESESGNQSENHKPEDQDIQYFERVFLERYKREFGFTLPDREIVVENIRVRCILKSPVNIDLDHTTNPNNEVDTVQTCTEPEMVTKCWFLSDPMDTKSIILTDTEVYLSSKLKLNTTIIGPAIIIVSNGTILVEPDWMCKITLKSNFLLSRTKTPNISNGPVLSEKISNGEWNATINDRFAMEVSSSSIDPIKLSLFCHRFMGIAERMGRMLKLTALSTNIKERLDFSCAIFAPDGGLIANAPHIPVHLGSMQQAVKYQMETVGSSLKPGDVILTNHPCAGGSHLPDLTVIKPYFQTQNHLNEPESTNNLKALFWVASRGHHADIGGILPGSMPATSTSLSQEGATFESFLIVQGGMFKEQEVIKEFMKPSQYPGCSGARRILDNIADLKAQIAACQKGIQLVNDLIGEYSLGEVMRYMNYIRTNAAQTVSQMFKSLADRKDLEAMSSIFIMNNNCRNELPTKDNNIQSLDCCLPYDYMANVTRRPNTTIEKLDKSILILSATDYMDDGTPIQLVVLVNTQKGTAIFDFTGTGYQVIGNCNTPKSITYSAILYCLRCMVGHDIPMNQGCLDPVEIIIPENSILNPSPEAAVVGGNVQTSQRIVDVIFKAFQTCAASQGCMNNVTFGVGDCVYYETIAGGAGAGPGFDGRSGVHTHMTNTRITDPETLERRFPVILKIFGLRPNSGGQGLYRGGNGIVREMIFRKAVDLSILTERRVFEPYGLKGGLGGKRGLNLIKRYHKNESKRDHDYVYLGSKSSTKIYPGDTFIILTPGGGGYGIPLKDENI